MIWASFGVERLPSGGEGWIRGAEPGHVRRYLDFEGQWESQFSMAKT
jgi:hypothetical protein